MTMQRIAAALIAIVALASPAIAQIKPGQAIQITISGVPAEEKSRFDQMYPVSDSGMINMPFIGWVRAAGLKAESLAATLQERYKSAEIYTTPTFQVFDSDQKRIEQQAVIVGGYVRRPGPVPFVRNLTVWQAIQSAGGPTEFGSMGRVEITRRGQVKEYDLNKSEYQQIQLLPEDAINVPPKNMFGN